MLICVCLCDGGGVVVQEEKEKAEKEFLKVAEAYEVRHCGTTDDHHATCSCPHLLPMNHATPLTYCSCRCLLWL